MTKKTGNIRDFFHYKDDGNQYLHADFKSEDKSNKFANFSDLECDGIFNIVEPGERVLLKGAEVLRVKNPEPYLTGPEGTSTTIVSGERVSTVEVEFTKHIFYAANESRGRERVKTITTSPDVVGKLTFSNDFGTLTVDGVKLVSVTHFDGDENLTLLARFELLPRKNSNLGILKSYREV